MTWSEEDANEHRWKVILMGDLCSRGLWWLCWLSEEPVHVAHESVELVILLMSRIAMTQSFHTQSLSSGMGLVINQPFSLLIAPG